MFAVNSTFANQNNKCEFIENNHSISECKITRHEPNESAYDLIIKRSIALQPIIKSFKKLLSKQLNKKECEKKIFVKSAKLQLADQGMKMSLRARLTRGYCTRRARQQVFEKTDGLKYKIHPVIKSNEIEFIDLNDDSNKASFEKSFTDVLSMNVKKKLNIVLNELFKSDIRHLNFSDESVDLNSIKFNSVRIDNESKMLLIEMAAKSK